LRIKRSKGAIPNLKELKSTKTDFIKKNSKIGSESFAHRD
jgi:hypothetical protein